MKYMIAFLALIIPFLGYAEDKFSAQITLSTTTLSIDEELTVHVTLSYPSSYHPNINLMRRNLLKYDGLNQTPFSFVNQTSSPPTQQAGITTENITFILSPQVIGEHFLSFEKIQFEDNNEQTFLISDVYPITVTTASIDFKPELLIAPVMPLTQQIPITINIYNRRHFIQNPQLVAQETSHSLSTIQSKSFPWFPILSAFVVFIAFLIIKATPRKKVTKEEVSRQDITKELLEEIKTITQSQLPEKGLSNLLFSQLDQTVRRYIENSYYINAPTSTTQEFLKKAAITPSLKPEMRSKIANFLQTADRVKFAKYNPTTQDCQEAIQAAQALIKGT